MNALFLVFVGGGIGASIRHIVNVVAARLFGISFPWGTMGINIAGSLAMGLLTAWLAARYEGMGQGLRLFLATGILGGFTTFSAFSLDAAVLWERGDHGAAAFYVIGSVGLSLAAIFAGLLIGRAVA